MFRRFSLMETSPPTISVSINQNRIFPLLRSLSTSSSPPKRKISTSAPANGQSINISPSSSPWYSRIGNSIRKSVLRRASSVIIEERRSKVRRFANSFFFK